MIFTLRWCSPILVLAIAAGAIAQDARLPLSALDLTKMSAGWGKPQIDMNCVEKPMSIAGQSLAHGVGTHANSLMHIELDGKVESFSAVVGVDDETKGKGTISFRVYGDGKKLFDTGIMKGVGKTMICSAELVPVQAFALADHRVVVGAPLAVQGKYLRQQWCR